MPGGHAPSRQVGLWGVEFDDAGLLMSGALEPRPRGSWWNGRRGLLGFKVLANDRLPAGLHQGGRSSKVPIVRQLIELRQ